jgi:formiminotetrahydrofolate cyclodeaminase
MENRLFMSSSCEHGMNEFIICVAAAEPIPGGGSVAALAGSLAAALGEMMAGLTEGRKKHALVEPQVREIHSKLIHLRIALRALVQEDPAAFKSLLDALKLPKTTEEEKSVRNEAIERATQEATLTPLRTAQAASETLECLKILVELGNPNAKCDLAVGAQMAYASLKGSQYNVLANISGLRDTSFAERCRKEILALVRRGHENLRHIDKWVAGS